MTSKLRMLLGFLVLTFCTSLVASDAYQRAWNIEGQHKPMKMKLVEVWDGYAFFTGNQIMGFFHLSQFPPDEQALIKSFEDEQMAQRGRLWTESESKFWNRSLRGQLFSVVDGKKQAFNIAEGKPEPDFYVFYYGASWCGPCHRFMPSLLSSNEIYRKMGFENYEIIFVSWDETTADQISYHQEYKMPFPLLKLGADETIPALRSIRPKSIPSIVIFDKDGHPLYQTYENGEYRGPQAVLGDLKRLLAWSNPENPISISIKCQNAKEHVLLKKPWGPNASAKRYHGKFSDELLAQLEPLMPLSLNISMNEKGKPDLAQSDLPKDIRDSVRKELQDWYFIPKMENGVFVETKGTLPIK